MLFKKKKMPLYKKLLLGSSVTALTAYIGSEINKATKRYEIKEAQYELTNYLLIKEQLEDDIKAMDQKYYSFDIVDKETNENKGKVQLLMGQEQDSFYGGHIRISTTELNDEDKKEIENKLIEVAKNHLMTHLNFVCNKKDENSIKHFEALGATFNKDIKIPPDSRYYLKNNNIIKQYRLNLIEEDDETKGA